MFDAATGKISRISVDASNDTLLLAATAGKRGAVIGGFLVAGATGGTFRFASNTTLISGTCVLGNNGVFILPPVGSPYAITAVEQQLVLDMVAGDVHGTLIVQLIT